MKFRTLIVFILAVLLAIFLIVNWEQLSAVTRVNLVFKEIEAPLGLLVVAGFGILVLALLFYTMLLQASVFFALRAANKDALNARKEASNADKNRFSELQDAVKTRLSDIEVTLEERQDTLKQDVLTRLNDLQTKLEALDKAHQTSLTEQRELVLNQFAALERHINTLTTEVKTDKIDARERKEMFSEIL